MTLRWSSLEKRESKRRIIGLDAESENDLLVKDGWMLFGRANKTVIVRRTGRSCSTDDSLMVKFREEREQEKNFWLRCRE